MSDVRPQAIALLVKKLREIEAEADKTHKRHSDRLAVRPIGLTFEEYNYHLDAKNLNYALAYRCEQLIEQIEAHSLFDELDAQDRAASAVEHVDHAEADAVREIEEEMALEAAGVESWEDL